MQDIHRLNGHPFSGNIINIICGLHLLWELLTGASVPQSFTGAWSLPDLALAISTFLDRSRSYPQPSRARSCSAEATGICSAVEDADIRLKTEASFCGVILEALSAAAPKDPDGCSKTEEKLCCVWLVGVLSVVALSYNVRNISLRRVGWLTL